jgi:nucleoside-diphosphate-sugar epimerase
MKNILVLGASGNVAPYVTPGLEPYYHIRLADIKPHPFGKPIVSVDMTVYEQVLEASRGMDAILNFTVLRNDPVLSFEVSTKGAYHVMKAAAELGIKKVIHTGPQLTSSGYTHDFDIDDVPPMPDTGYYGITKYLSMEICKIYARAYGIHVVCFLFAGLGARPTESITRRAFPDFMIVWEDLQHACRLALEVEVVPENFQVFNMMSYLSHGKHSIERVKRILGYEPLERVEEYFRRTT